MPADAYPWSGSIPACAGEPIRSGVYCTVAWVHPRVCGGAGADRSTSRQLHRGGSIPACAGEPLSDY